MGRFHALAGTRTMHHRPRPLTPHTPNTVELYSMYLLSLLVELKLTGSMIYNTLFLLELKHLYTKLGLICVLLYCKYFILLMD